MGTHNKWKMQAPKPYENHRLAQFLWDTFQTRDFNSETMDHSIKTFSLPYDQNNPQHIVDEISDG